MVLSEIDMLDIGYAIFNYSLKLDE